MSETPNQQAAELLGQVFVPYLEDYLGATGAVLEWQGDSCVARMGFAAGRYGRELEAEARTRLDAAGLGQVAFSVDWAVRRHRVQAALKPLEGVKNIIAVASGKGGVGKSTCAVNVALALAQEGAQVGVLDADIYGPSLPTLLGLAGVRPESDGKLLEPLEAHGVKAMSIGFLVSPDQAMAWRGPMVTAALNQLLLQTRWGDLDYLVVDMPPGTGDIQLTLAQRVPVSGAVVITTPQDIALIDARKGLKMFEKVNVATLGIVENMAFHRCTSCGHEDAIFGTGGGERLAAETGTALLGRLPLDARIRSDADGGRPSVVAQPESEEAQAFREVALHAAGRLAKRGHDTSHRFPEIRVEA